MHFEQHLELDNLIAMQNLRNSANKGSNDAYDVSVSLTPHPHHRHHHHRHHHHTTDTPPHTPPYRGWLTSLSDTSYLSLQVKVSDLFSPATALVAFKSDASRNAPGQTRARVHTDRRRDTFIVAARHRDFIKNMTTGALQADMTLIMVCVST